MKRARCLKTLNEVRNSLKEVETLIINENFLEARAELLFTTKGMIDRLYDEMEAEKE